MKWHINKGFLLTEIVIVLNIVFIIMGITYFVVDRSIYNKQRHIINNNIILSGYNIIQIIKSDSYFYRHPEIYFNNSKDLITVNIKERNFNFELYFDKNNNIVEKGLHDYYIVVHGSLALEYITYYINLYDNYYRSIGVCIEAYSITKWYEK